MPMTGEVRRIPLTEAAQRLGMSYNKAWNAVLSGTLDGKKEEGRWVVSEDSVKRAGTSHPPQAA